MKISLIPARQSRALFLIILLGLTGSSFVITAAELDPKSLKVTASSWEQKAHGGWGDMPPERALDGDLKTAWMAEGDGEWIQFDLGAVQKIKAVKLAFAKGNERVYTVDIQTSETGTDKTWSTVLEKGKNTGKSLDPESFDLKSTPARFVRVLGYGNTSEKFPKWCNITEATIIVD
jgi:hypothetical protein